MYKKTYKALFAGILFFMSACGDNASTDDVKSGDKILIENKTTLEVPIEDKTVIVFRDVSSRVIDDFGDFFDKNDISRNYYSDFYKSCADIGFKYLDIKYLEGYTYSKRYISKNTSSYCFEITSDGEGYKGQINSVMMVDYID